MALTTRDVEVLDEQDDVGSGVGSADADVAELAGDAQGDGAGLVDACRGGSGRGCRCRGWGRAGPWAWCRRALWGWPGAAGTGAGGGVVRRAGTRRAGLCRSAMVAGWRGWARSQFFMVCWKRLDLAAGGGVVGSGVLLDHVPGAELGARSRCGRRGVRCRPGGRCRPSRCRSGWRLGCRAGLRFRGMCLDDRGGDRAVRGHVQGVAGAVVEPGDDLHAAWGVRRCRRVGSG